MDRRVFLAALGATAASARSARAETPGWSAVLAAARGRAVYWNAWGGDERTNAFIAWVGEEARRRHEVTLVHVKLKDTAEAVTRVVAEKAAGRSSGGGVDLIWINGPNLYAMKSQGLLFGPFVERLPNWPLVDTTGKISNVVDFTLPVEGMASPWALAQIVYVYDARRTEATTLPRSIPAMLDWARRHPGRLTHPTVRDFLGATFLKQALYELAPDISALGAPVNDAAFAPAAAALWSWYDALRPALWRQGTAFPESGPAHLRLLADGEVDLAISFNPAIAAVGTANGTLPDTARVFVLDRGTIGNTSFVAIPYNAANSAGAMVVANLLLEPEAQARAQDPANMGAFSVLDLAKLTPEARGFFAALRSSPALPSNEDLGAPLPEPHPSWMTRIVAEWERRYIR